MRVIYLRDAPVWATMCMRVFSITSVACLPITVRRIHPQEVSVRLVEMRDKPVRVSDQNAVMDVVQNQPVCLQLIEKLCRKRVRTR